MTSEITSELTRELPELKVLGVSPEPNSWRSGIPSVFYASMLVENNYWEVFDGDAVYKEATLSDRHTMYVAQATNGLTRYLLHDSKSEQGFGGREFRITLEGGERRMIKGPWSSRAEIVNDLIFDEQFMDVAPIIDCTIYGETWRSVGMASAVRVNLFVGAVRKYLGRNWHVAWVENNAELHPTHGTDCPGVRIE